MAQEVILVTFIPANYFSLVLNVQTSK